MAEEILARTFQASDEGAVAISDSLAEGFGLRVGDTFELPAPIAPLALRVGAIVPDYILQLGAVKLPWHTFVRHFGDDRASMLFVGAKRGATPVAVKRAIESWEARPFESIPQQTLLRLYHTIKGAANSIGLSHMGRLAHGMEDLFTALDEERLRLPHDQKISLAAKSVQVLRQCLHRATSKPPVFSVPATLDELLKRIERITGTVGLADYDEPEPAAASLVEVTQIPSGPLTAAEELEERADRIIKEAAAETSAPD